MVVFYYDSFAGAKEELAKNDLTLHYLATWWDVLKACRAEGHFDTKTLDQVEAFLHDPLKWSEQNGGAYELAK